MRSRGGCVIPASVSTKPLLGKYATLNIQYLLPCFLPSAKAERKRRQAMVEAPDSAKPILLLAVASSAGSAGPTPCGPARVAAANI